MWDLVCGFRMGIPKCPWIRQTIHKSFVSLAECSAACWNLPPRAAFCKPENEERGPGGGQMGRAKGVLGWHLCLRSSAQLGISPALS